MKRKQKKILIEDVWWPQCCYLDNDKLIIDDEGNIVNDCRCPYPARWEIKGQTEPRTHSCDLHLPILLEDKGINTVTILC